VAVMTCAVSVSSSASNLKASQNAYRAAGFQFLSSRGQAAASLVDMERDDGIARLGCATNSTWPDGSSVMKRGTLPHQGRDGPQAPD
jgi:hypothetical protein